jgi:hypothetical protein
MRADDDERTAAATRDPGEQMAEAMYRECKSSP